MHGGGGELGEEGGFEAALQAADLLAGGSLKQVFALMSPAHFVHAVDKGVQAGDVGKGSFAEPV